MSIDRTTYSVTTIGPLGIGGDFGDMTWDPVTDTLYAVSGRGNDALYTINKATGAATLVGFHNVNDVFALAYNVADGKLYAQATHSVLYTLDAGTGAATAVGSNSVYPGGLAFSIALNALLLNEPSSGDIYSVNTATSAASLVASNGFINDNGFTEDRDFGGHWAADWNNSLYRYDSALNRTTVANLGAPYAAVAWVGVAAGTVPEPGTGALAALGLIAAVLGRRRIR